MTVTLCFHCCPYRWRYPSKCSTSKRWGNKQYPSCCFLLLKPPSWAPRVIVEGKADFCYSCDVEVNLVLKYLLQVFAFSWCVCVFVYILHIYSVAFHNWLKPDWRTFDYEVGVKIVGSFQLLLLDACSFRNPFHSQFNSLSLQEIFIHLFPLLRNLFGEKLGLRLARNGVHISFVYCWETEKEVIKKTISCSRREREGKDICFPFRASSNPTGNSLHFLSYAAAINSTVRYMRWQAVEPQITQVMSVEMWKLKKQILTGVITYKQTVFVRLWSVRGPSRARRLTGIKRELLRMMDAYGGCEAIVSHLF